MTDYIKREDAIEQARRNWIGEGEWIASTEIQLLKNLPSADVVEADKAQKEIDYWHDKAQSYEQTILKLTLNKADGVEVVRCKDCIRYNTDDCFMIHGKNMNRNLFDDDYCSYGEREEE